MTTTTWTVVCGNIGDTVTVDVGGVADLTGAVSAVGHVYKGATVHELDATITSTAGVEIVVELGDADGWLASAEAGDWSFDVDVTYGDGRTITFPQGAPMTLKARAHPAAA